MKASSTRKLSVFFLVGVFYTLCCSNAHAAVQTYPPLTGSDHEQHGSSRYSVHVRPANTSSYRYAYTYRSDNDIEDNPGDCSNPAGGCGPQQHPFSRPIMSNANHWSSFDSDDDEIEFEVKAWWGAPTGYRILPADLPVSDISFVGNQLNFKLNRPVNDRSGIQFSIEFLGNNNYDGHPLFIFANPMFAGCPAGDVPPGQTWVSSGSNVTVGRPGEVSPSEFNWGLWNNASICIPGGAYVKGRLEGTNVSNVSITGRGIFSGIHKSHSTASGWVGHLVSINGSQGSNNRISGITMTDSPKGFIEVYSQLAVENVKLMGWHVNTDGILVGSGSTVDDVFLKVNDDAIKLMYSNVHMHNIVAWQQAAGSVVQLAWNNQWPLVDSTVSKLRLIHVDQNRDIGQNQNGSIVAARNMMGGAIRNVKISDVVAYDNPYNVLLLQLNDELVYRDVNRQNIKCQSRVNPRPERYSCNALDGNGRIEVITLENVVTPPQVVKSLVHLNGDEQAGIGHSDELSYLNAQDVIRNVRLIDVVVGGKKLVHWNSVNPNHAYVTEQLDLIPSWALPVGDVNGILAY